MTKVRREAEFTGRRPSHMFPPGDYETPQIFDLGKCNTYGELCELTQLLLYSIGWGIKYHVMGSHDEFYWLITKQEAIRLLPLLAESDTSPTTLVEKYLVEPIRMYERQTYLDIHLLFQVLFRVYFENTTSLLNDFCSSALLQRFKDALIPYLAVLVEKRDEAITPEQ